MLILNPFETKVKCIKVKCIAIFLLSVGRIKLDVFVDMFHYLVTIIIT